MPAFTQVADEVATYARVVAHVARCRLGDAHMFVLRVFQVARDSNARNGRVPGFIPGDTPEDACLLLERLVDWAGKAGALARALQHEMVDLLELLPDGLRVRGAAVRYGRMRKGKAAVDPELSAKRKAAAAASHAARRAKPAPAMGFVEVAPPPPPPVLHPVLQTDLQTAVQTDVQTASKICPQMEMENNSTQPTQLEEIRLRPARAARVAQAEPEDLPPVPDDVAAAVFEAGEAECRATFPRELPRTMPEGWAGRLAPVLEACGGDVEALKQVVRTWPRDRAARRADPKGSWALFLQPNIWSKTLEAARLEQLELRAACPLCDVPGCEREAATGEFGGARLCYGHYGRAIEQGLDWQSDVRAWAQAGAEVRP